MLVNAQQFPVPAMWQGIMLVVVAIWLVWSSSGKRSRDAFEFSILILILVGIVLAGLLNHFFNS